MVVTIGIKASARNVARNPFGILANVIISPRKEKTTETILKIVTFPPLKSKYLNYR